MSYKSTIELITSQTCSSIEDAIYKSVLNVGINVDKEELLKALEYDRGQYQKGYDDRDAAIVRCHECVNRECDGRAGTVVCGITGEAHSRLWFCADGERRTDDA